MGGSRGNAVLSAVGSLVAAVKASFKRSAALSSSGTLSASAVGRIFTNVGMNKVGTFDNGTSMTKITGWSADTTNYPETVVTSDSLIVIGGGTVNAVVHVEGRRSSSFYSQTYRVHVNGSPAGVGYTYTSGSNTFTVDFTDSITVSDGDVVDLRRESSTAGSGISNYVGSGTYIHLVMP